MTTDNIAKNKVQLSKETITQHMLHKYKETKTKNKPPLLRRSETWAVKSLS